MSHTFPFTLPGLDAVSTEWVTFSLIWAVFGTLTFARFLGLLTGSLLARLSGSPASLTLGVPGVVFVFFSVLAHFAVLIGIVAEVADADGVLGPLKAQITGLMFPMGSVVETLLPPLGALHRLHWDYLPLAAILVVTSETLLRMAAGAADQVRKDRQLDVLHGISKKVKEKTLAD